MALYGAEMWTLRAADQKYLESFEMWCWRRMEKIIWTDHVRNEEVLLRVNEQRNILHEIRKRKANWIGHILRRNCLLKQVIEGKIKGDMEVARRRERRRKKLLDDLKDRRGYSHLKEEALDSTMWRHRFGGSFGSVVRQNTEWMNLVCNEEKWRFSPEFRKVHCRIFRNKDKDTIILITRAEDSGVHNELLFYFCYSQFLQNRNSNYNLLP